MSRRILAFLIAGVMWAQAPCPTPLPRSGEEAFIVVPDPQFEAKEEGTVNPAHTYFTHLTDSILANAAAYNARNILWVGDIVDSNDATTCVSQPTWAPQEYAVALTNIQRLIAAGYIPMLVKGNHDECSTNWTNFISQIVGDDEPPYTGRPSWVYRIQRASESGNGTDRYQTILYQTTLVGKPLLVIAHYHRSLGNTSAQVIANYTWAKARKAEWLAANPGGHVWILTHEWFNYDGSYLSYIAPSASGNLSNGGNQWKNETDVEMLWSGHWDQYQGLAAKHFGFRPKIDTGTNHIRQVSIDYQITSPETYTVWRITPSGQVDGCAYKAVTRNYSVYDEATHPTWAPLTRSQGWQSSEWDWASFRLPWGGLFPMPASVGR